MAVGSLSRLLMWDVGLVGCGRRVLERLVLINGILYQLTVALRLLGMLLNVLLSVVVRRGRQLLLWELPLLLVVDNAFKSRELLVVRRIIHDANVDRIEDKNLEVRSLAMGRYSFVDIELTARMIPVH